MNKLPGTVLFHCLLSACLFAPVVMAQEFPHADRKHRQGMSYEEYSAQREQMRLRMKKMHDEEDMRSSMQKPHTEQTEKPRMEGTYGQGFHSRNRHEDRQDTSMNNRQDRPRVERINRGERMRSR